MKRLAILLIVAAALLAPSAALASGVVLKVQKATHLVAVTNGKAKVLQRWFVKKIPDIGDGSTCSGAVPTVK